MQAQATVTQHPASTPEHLVSLYAEQKQRVEDEKARLLELETLIIEALGKPEQGSVTHKLEGCRVTVKQPYTFSIPKDIPDDQLNQVNNALVAGGGEPIFIREVKWAIDKHALEHSRTMSPQWFAQYVAPNVVGKAGKPAIEVKI